MRNAKNYFADSSFLVDLSKNRDKAVEIAENARSISSSTLCIYELSKLAKFDPKNVKDNKLSKLELRDVELSGKLYRGLRDRGEMINQMDILIAAQAINRDRTLLTADKDFRKIEELETRYYRDS